MPPSALPGPEVLYFLLFMLIFFLVQLPFRRRWQLSLEGIWLTCFAGLATTFYFRVEINLLLLTGVCLGLLVVATGLWVWNLRQALEVTRDVPPEVVAQQQVTIQYHLHNRSRSWLLGLSFRDEATRGILPLPGSGLPVQMRDPSRFAPPSLEVSDDGEHYENDPFDQHPNQRPVPKFPILRCFLRPGEALTIDQPVLFTTRGLYRLGPFASWVRDPLGLHTLAQPIATWDLLQVLPTWTPLESLPREMLSIQRMDEETTDEREGLSTEFRSIREYRPGDSLKRIHWGLTARHQQLMVRQYQHLVGEAWGILLDLHEGTELGIGAQSDQERLIALAASLSGTLSLQERPYAIALAMQQLVVLDPHESGMDHTAVLRLLAAVRFDRRTALDLSLEEAMHTYPDRPWLILTTRPQSDVLQALELVRRIQPTPAVVLIDHTSLASQMSAQERFMRPERIGRSSSDSIASFIEQATAAGVRVYHQTPQTQLARAFEGGREEVVAEFAGVGS